MIVYINHQFPIVELIFRIIFNCNIKKLNGFISEIKCYINNNDLELTRSFKSCHSI